ncbi:MAG: ATP-binding protein [Planctomycetaceae bacterium]|nr:ATP-binding protein [Planctomycetaceae bacterium]
MWLLLLICAPLVLSLIDCARDIYCDAGMIRAVALRSEMGQLRSQTARRAGRLESLLEANAASAASSGPFDWPALRDQPWLATEWADVGKPVGRERYLAVVDPLGTIVLHTDPAAVGKQLTSEWDDHKEPEAGSDVVRIASGPLTGNSAALDVNVPLIAGGAPIGSVHSGLDAASFDSKVAAQQRQQFWKRSWLVGLVLAANLGAAIGIVLLIRDFSHLRHKLAQSVQRHARQLAQLGMGLAHEIRNPLHALRINVHTLRRSGGRTSLSEQQVTEILHESSDEIDRMDSLVRDFVQFAVPQSGEVSQADLTQAVQATLHLLAEELRRKQIELTTKFSPDRLIVRLDPDRLRQIALNLLTFAQRSAGDKGKIEVSTGQVDQSAELIIADSGPGLSDLELTRLFEPFQSTAHSDAGLSLALIHRLATDAAGTIERRQGAGLNCFRLLIPLAKRSPQGT